MLKYVCVAFLLSISSLRRRASCNFTPLPALPPTILSPFVCMYPAPLLASQTILLLFSSVDYACDANFWQNRSQLFRSVTCLFLLTCGTCELGALCYTERQLINACRVIQVWRMRCDVLSRQSGQKLRRMLFVVSSRFVSLHLRRASSAFSLIISCLMAIRSWFLRVLRPRAFAEDSNSPLFDKAESAYILRSFALG